MRILVGIGTTGLESVEKELGILVYERDCQILCPVTTSKIGALSDNGISDTCRTKRTSRRTVCTILPLSIIPRTPVPS